MERLLFVNGDSHESTEDDSTCSLVDTSNRASQILFRHILRSSEPISILSPQLSATHSYQLHRAVATRFASLDGQVFPSHRQVVGAS